MSRPIRIAPSVLSSDFGRLAEEVKAVEAAGADLIHVDVMDGMFVPNITIGPVVVAAIRRATELPLDVHLMIEDPGRYIDAFADAGADTIGVHVEACVHLHRVVQQIKHAGKHALKLTNALRHKRIKVKVVVRVPGQARVVRTLKVGKPVH